MHVIDKRLYLSKEDCFRGALGQPVLSPTWAVWTYPGNGFEFPEPVVIAGVKHWEAEELKDFVERRRG
ncbi:hypothetical protein [Sulfitobacter dubius]|uniref:hypothetical protein n=1 Tax=Sulfitobacter dubius TaxID=218673 RepID=UPI002942DCA5|nr:hypothetical protein [Sulfitobacter dubius]WOI29357.1 hypothetical protein R1T39_01205 [Sulfitobacter dubius]